MSRHFGLSLGVNRLISIAKQGLNTNIESYSAL